MEAQVGSEALRKAGINSIADLIPFPWERQHHDLPTEDEAAAMLSEMNAINAQRQSSIKVTTTPTDSPTGQQESSEE